VFNTILTPSKNTAPKPCLTVRQDGFSLIEVTVALTVFLIVLMGISSVFFYVVVANAGNNTRTQALMIAQQEVELVRNARFSPLQTDSILAGGVHSTKTITTTNGGIFNVDTAVDDDTTTDGIQIDPNRTLKEVTITVSLARPTPGWQATMPVKMIFYRARSN